MEERNETGLITEQEMALADFCVESAMKHGASQVRISLGKSVLDSFSTLNGELDKVTHAADRSVYMYIFADNRYGTFSTNMLEKDEIDKFIRKAVKSVRMLAEDPLRKLPEPSRTATDALTGNELKLYDSDYGLLSCQDARLGTALAECRMEAFQESPDYSIVSEECEYSDSVDDNYVTDSNGFRGRHTETSFSICSEVTIEDGEGTKYSGYWWESSPYLSGLKRGVCSDIALQRAARQLGTAAGRSGKYPMVVDRSVSSRLVAPIISALGASSIQQKNSFLEGTLGTKVFSDKVTLSDMAREEGKCGSRLFDTEGVATGNIQVIENGIIRTYFVNTYMAAKMDIAPTVEGCSRPVLQSYRADDGEYAASDRKQTADNATPATVDAETLIKDCRTGIYVTGFNGGNCNSTTGDFSYGIEGFVFEDGKIVAPVKEMLITGNMKTLWNNVLAVGNDARECTRWQIPSVAFENVDFSG